MGAITSNPTISLQRNIGSPWLLYIADGAAIFGCIGSPEGAIIANARSIAITEVGAVYVKTTDGVNTGWSMISGGGGGGTITGTIAITQVAVGTAVDQIGGSAALTFSSGGLVNLQSIAGETGYIANQNFSSAASAAYFYMQTPSAASILRLTTALFTPAGLVKGNQVDFLAGNAIVEMLFRLQDASTRFVFGVANAEAFSINATISENLVAGAPSSATVPQRGALKFYNTTNANYLQLRATAFGASRIWDLPTTAPTGTQALVGSISGSTVTLDWASAGAVLTATRIGFGDGSNNLTGSADFLYDDSIGAVDLTKTLDSSVRLVVTNNNAGNAAQARLAASADISGGALAAYSSTFVTSGLRVANSVVLDLDGPTSIILGQAAGTFKIGLGTTEYIRMTSTVFTVFGSIAGSVTGASITSTAAGGGVTLQAISSGTNEHLTVKGKGAGNVIVTGGLQAYGSNDNGVIIGLSAAASSLTTDTVAIGFFARAGTTSGGTSSVNIGRHAGFDAAVSNAVFIGHAAGQYAYDGASCVSIGYLANRNTPQNAAHHSFGSVIIGHSAAESALNAQSSVIIGEDAASLCTSPTSCVIIGNTAGRDAVNAVGSVLIGKWAGLAATNCQNSILIGNEAGRSLSRNNTLIIDGNTTYSTTNTGLIYGELDNRVLRFNGNVGIFTSTFGTSAAGVFAIFGGTAPTTQPADTVQSWVRDAVAGKAELYAMDEAGYTARLTGCTKILNQEFPTTSTTLADVVGSAAKYNLSHDVEASRRYVFEIWFVTDNELASGVKVNIAGTATMTHSRASYEITQLAATGLGVVDQYAEESTFSTTVAKATTTGLNFIVKIKGSFIVNAAGTVVLQFAQATATGTGKVRQGAYFEISMSE